MRCGHCKTKGVTVDHVRSCSYNEQMIRGIGASAEVPEEIEPEVLERNAPVTEAGFYQQGEHIYKVQVAHHGSGRLYAKELIVTEPLCGGCANGEPCEPTPCPPTRAWEYRPGLVKSLRAGDRITAEQAKAFSALYGVCVFCAKPLTDERSIYAGYGEKCSQNHGLPWGEVGAA